MFAAGGSLRRLQMCADCRVVDMMENKDEISIQDVCHELEQAPLGGDATKLMVLPPTGGRSIGG
jgi:hypothetical protein